MTRRLSLSLLTAESSVVIWGIALILSVLICSTAFADDLAGGAVPPPGASYEQVQPSTPPATAAGEIVADKYKFQVLSAGKVSLILQVGDNDGYGYGAATVPDGATLPRTSDPNGYWFFENRTTAEKNDANATATDHEAWNQQDYTLVYTFNPNWFSGIDSAVYTFDVSGVQQVNMCPDNPTGRSHLLFDGVEQTAFLSINQGVLGSGVYRYPVSVKTIFDDGRLNVLFDQHNDCYVSPYGDVWAIDFAALQVFGNEAPVPVPTPQTPSAGTTVGNPSPTFTWSNEGVQYYWLQVSTSPDFGSPYTYGKISSTSFTIPQSLSNSTYYWRVGGQSIFGTQGSYSASKSFTVAASLVVPTNFPTIQAAVNAASAGDTIYVEPGTYPSKGNADFTVGATSSLVIMSTGGAKNTIIQADASSYGIYISRAPKCELRGFTIKGYTGNYSSLVNLTYPDSVLIADCIFDGGSGSDIDASGVDMVSTATISGCAFTNCGSSAINSNGPYLVLDSCRFENNYQCLYYYPPLGKSPANAKAEADIVLKGCDFLNSTYSAANMSYAGSVVIDSCNFEGNGDGALSLYYTDAAVSNCSFRNNTVVESSCGGIGVFYYSSLNLSSSLFENNSGYYAGAVYYGYGATGLSISGCSFIGNEPGAVEIDDAGGKAPNQPKDHPPLAAAPAATITIDHSNFNFNKSAPGINLNYVNSGDVFTLTCCNIASNPGGDWIQQLADQLGINGNTDDDPLFCDTTGGNYTVAANSPLADSSCGKIGLTEVGCGAVEFALSSDSLYFDAVKDESAPPSQNVTLSNLGGSVLSWTRQAVIPSWLNATPITGTAPSTLTFSVIPGFQSIGVYVDTVLYSSSAAINSPFGVIVVLNVRSPNSPPVIDSVNDVPTAGSDSVKFSVPEGTVFNATVKASDPDEDSLTLKAYNYPSGASFSDHGDGTGLFHWTTLNPLSDTNVVMVVASDGEFADTINIVIVIQPNTAPVFSTTFTNVQVVEGTQYTLDIAVNDPDEQIVIIAWNGVPAGASFVDHGDRTAAFSYTPDYNAVGQTFAVSFYTSDGVAADTGSFTLEVLNNPLVVEGASPSPGGTSSDVLVTDVIRIDFNELIDQSSLTGNVTATSTLGQSLTIQPGVDESGSAPHSYILIARSEQKYRERDQISLQIGAGVTDLAGYPIDKAYSYSFSTGVSVSPGDMTNDGVVNERDLLPLGIYWGKTGPARPSQSLAWGSFASHIFAGGQTWAPFQAVYADADGNGAVDGTDICGITDNWHAALTSHPNKLADVVEEVKKSFAGMAASTLSDMYQAALECEPSAGKVVVLKGLEESLGLGGESLPSDFTLYQNYPNPFNPSTMIKFYLPESGSVRLSVYNLLGQEVARLVDGHRDKGFTEVEWDATDGSGHRVASGLYFYRLTTETQSLTKRMLLVK